MRVAAYGMAILAVSTSILVLLIYGQYWQGGPNIFQIVESAVFVFSILAVLIIVFSGWVKRHPRPALLAFFLWFVFGLLFIGYWWIAGGFCDLAVWRYGHTTCL